MRKIFVKYIQSVCTPEEFNEIADWFSDKEKDLYVSGLMKSSWNQFMEQCPEDFLNQDLWRKINREIKKEEKGFRRKKLKLYTWGLRLAAALILALIIGNIYQLKKPDRREPFIQTQTVIVPNGARSTFILPDSSRVVLNSGSSLTYNSDFDKSRMVTLEGEAYFEVKKSKNPFSVSTPFGIIMVTGTNFNVKAFFSANEFTTTVEDGSVVVTNNRLMKKALLEKGQQAKLVNGQLFTSKVETDLYTSWKDGKIIFRKEYLPEVAIRLGYWYNVKIVLSDDPRLKKIHYTGTLEMESFSEVLELLKKTAPITYHFNDKTRVIEIKHR